MKYPRGSEWRKWDYHVHTPASWYYKGGEDAYPKIVDAIHQSDYAAFGINDYLTVDGYLNLRPVVKKPIFPVVEFRMTDILVDKNKAGGPHFNFHLLFTNDDNCLGNISSFLAALQFEDFHGNKRNLTAAEIEDFGKQVTPSETDPAKLRNAAMEKIKFRFSDVTEMLKAKGLRDQCLVIMPYDEHGGIDNIDPNADGLQKSGLIRGADMIGSSSLAVRQYFLGLADRYTKEQFALWIGKPKPIIKGSDAHRPEDIGHLPRKSDGLGIHCWVKADLTFQGLKQTLFEPEHRIFIGSTPPDNKDKSKVIESVSIRSSNGWFEDQTIPLNRDLVCIIGGKGSGKTALVDLLGLTGGDFDVRNESAFLSKANQELEHTKLLLKWEDGKTEAELQIERPLNIPVDQKVRYLSQSFVESLCSFDRHAQLEREIEGILFQYIPGTETLGTESFEALKQKRTEGIQLEIDGLSTRIGSLNEEIHGLGILINSRAQLVKDRDQLEKDIAELNKQKPQPSTDEERKVADELRTLSEARATLASTVEQIRIKQSRLEVLIRKLRVVSESVDQFNTEVERVLKDVGEPGMITDLKILLPARGAQLLSDKCQELGRQAATVAGTPVTTKEGAETVASLDQKIATLNQKSSAEVQKRTKLQEFTRRIADHVQKRDALSNKIALIEQTSRKEREDKKQQRNQLFLSFFNKLEEKRHVLEQLYAPLNAQAATTSEGAKVQFYARYTFDARHFAEDAGDLFDQRKSVIRGEQAFIDAGRRFWENIAKKLPQADYAAVSSLLDDLQTRGSEKRGISEQLRSNKTTHDFSNWLFSLAYYDVEYGIKYEGTDLDKLSPGKKGVVLLLIYLTIDKDYRPLIVDQPEENLDNRSVYSTLVEYFRKAKLNRQVIIVTHNANLVVNGDAEQVIVANYEIDRATQPVRIRYISGSLENSALYASTEVNVLDRQGIREHVCELLEGGEDAFERREEKYGFPK